MVILINIISMLLRINHALRITIIVSFLSNEFIRSRITVIASTAIMTLKIQYTNNHVNPRYIYILFIY